MRKNFGPHTWMYPMPVLIVGTYNADGTANAMNAAWGGIYDTNQLMLCLGERHKTTQNIRQTGCFTVSMATVKTLVAADYVGLVSGHTVPDKLERAGLHPEPAEFVNAPVFREMPMALECKLVKFNEDGIVVGEIVNVCAAEEVLGEDGLIDVAKLDPISYDSPHHHYLRLGEKVGNAFGDGNRLK